MDFQRVKYLKLHGRTSLIKMGIESIAAAVSGWKIARTWRRMADIIQLQ